MIYNNRIKLFITALTFLFVSNTFVFSQDYSLYIDRSTTYTWPQPLNRYFVNKINNGYFTLFCEDSPAGPNPFFNTDLKIKKLDLNGSTIAEHIIYKNWERTITPECFRIGENYRIVSQFIDRDNFKDILYWSLLYDQDLNLLEDTTIRISEYPACNLSGYPPIGTWKTIGDTTGHFSHLDCKYSHYRLLALYDSSGYYLGMKDSTFLNREQKNAIYTKPFDINAGKNFVIATDRFNVYDRQWNLIDDSKANLLINYDSDENPTAYVSNKTGFFALYGFIPDLDVFNTSSKKLIINKFDNNLNLINKTSIKYTPPYYPFPWHPITPQGGLFKTDDGNYSVITSLDKGFCGCSDDTLSSYISRITFDEDMNIVCHKEFRLPKHRVRLGYITDMNDGSMLITGIMDTLFYPYSKVKEYHPFFAYIPKNSCDIPWAHQVFNVGVNINKLLKLSGTINCFPNPAMEEVVFSYDLFSERQELTIQIFNSTGEVVLNKIWNTKNERFDIRHLPSNQYIYVVTNKDGYYASGKFIKI